jgi:hypothetical protein
MREGYGSLGPGLLRYVCAEHKLQTRSELLIVAFAAFDFRSQPQKFTFVLSSRSLLSFQ